MKRANRRMNKDHKARPQLRTDIALAILFLGLVAIIASSLIRLYTMEAQCEIAAGGAYIFDDSQEDK